MMTSVNGVLRISGNYGESKSTSGYEPTLDAHAARLTGSNQIIENPIDYRFVERMYIAI